MAEEKEVKPEDMPEPETEQPEDVTDIEVIDYGTGE